MTTGYTSRLSAGVQKLRSSRMTHVPSPLQPDIVLPPEVGVNEAAAFDASSTTVFQGSWFMPADFSTKTPLLAIGRGRIELQNGRAKHQKAT